jgi:hypothetical protein
LKIKKITDQETVAETFNEYFVTIAAKVNRLSKNNLMKNEGDKIDR